MSRPARPWFRFYVEAFKDFKVLRLDPAERWVWGAVLGAARESCEPGKLLIAPGEAMSVDELARYADVPHDQVWTALEKMRRYGMVDWDEDGLIVVQNWDARQYESDSSTKRTSQWRHKEQDSDSVGDNIVTDQIQKQNTDAEPERESGAIAPTRKRGKTAIPSPFTISERNLEWVRVTYPTLDFDLETQKLVAWAKANDRRYADWDQAWRNWMHRAAERRPL